MRKLILGISLFQASLFGWDGLERSAAIFEGIPASNLDKHVSTATGEFYLAESDIVARGVESLSIQRVYLSESSAFQQEKWTILPHLRLREHMDGMYLTTHDEDGAPLVFTKGKQVLEYIFDTSSVKHTLTNTGKGTISGATHPRNHKGYRFSNTHVEITTPSGIKRNYKRHRYWHMTYFLKEEYRPNGHIITYEYDARNRIQKITAWNSTKTKKLAHLTFSRPEGYQQVTVTTHTGDWIQYRYHVVPDEYGNNHECYYQFTSNTKQREDLAFVHGDDYKKFIICERSYEDKSKESVRYYKQDGIYNIHGHGQFTLKQPGDPRCGRVESVGLDPHGNGVIEFPYQLLYHIPVWDRRKGYENDPVTEVVYQTGYHDVYTYTPHFRLKRKARKNADRSERYVTEYEWGKGDNNGLLMEQKELESGRCYFKRAYTYSNIFDVTKEVYSGDLTGRGESSFTTTTTYSDDELHLPLTRTNDLGHVEEYTYLQKTNLPTRIIHTDSARSIAQRTFLTYDENHLIIEKIEDDSLSQIPEDFSDAHLRKRTVISRYDTFPHVGLPRIVEEYGYDFEANEERLIRKTHLFYNKQGHPDYICILDANDTYQYTLSYTYDEAGRCISETDPLGRETIRTYWKNGLLNTEKKGNSHITTKSEYDTAHRLVQRTLSTNDGIQQNKQFSYNILAHLLTETDELGNTISYTRDEHGYTLQETVPDLDGATATTAFVNDYQGKPLTVTDPEGRHNTCTYTCLGKKQQERPFFGPEVNNYYTPQGELQETKTLETTTTYTHDRFGRLIEESITPHDHAQHPRKTTKKYSGHLLLEEADYKGIITKYTYDHAGRIASKTRRTKKETYSYDALGRCTTEKTYLGDTLLSATKKTYDFCNRKITEIHTNALGEVLQHTQLEYDTADNIIAEKVIVGEETSLITRLYDGLGRVIRETNRSDETTCYEYTDGILFKSLRCRQKKTYLPSGLLITEIIHPNGKLLQKTTDSPTGTRLQEILTYNKTGDLLRHEFHEEETMTIYYFYDERNRICAIEEDTSSEFTTTHMSYDMMNRIIATQKQDGTTVSRKYDSFDQEITLSCSDGHVNYAITYDQFGNITHAKNLITNAQTTRSYNPDGELIQETLEHGYTIRRGIDDVGRKKALTLQDQTAILYQYRGDKLKQISLQRGDTCNVLHTYDQYDEEGNLLQETRGDGSIATYTYDQSGRFLTSNSSTYTEAITGYSDTGNVLGHTIKDHRAYTYDEFENITSENNVDYTFTPYHQLTTKNDRPTHRKGTRTIAYKDTTYEYDTCGRLSKKTTPTDETYYYYDGLDRLIAVQTPTHLIQYQYDLFNRRTVEKTNTIAKYYLYDNTLEIGATDEQHTLTELRVLGLGIGGETGSAVALFINNTHYIPVNDCIGNLRALYDTQQHLIEYYDFTIFGEHLPEHSISPWIYQSKRHNLLTGLIHFADRYYDPELIAWTTPDPLTFHEGPNYYAFLQANPFRYYDEYGNETLNIHPIVALEEHNTYEHVPPTSDLYCPFEAKLNPTKQSHVTSLQAAFPDRTFIDGSKESPQNLLFVTNGIRTDFDGLVQAALRISEIAGGRDVHMVYNQTHGIATDVKECLDGLDGFLTKPSKLISSVMETFYDKFGKNTRGLWLIHSQGGINMYNAIARTDTEITKQFGFINCAGAKDIPEACGFRSINYQAHPYRDFVPQLQYVHSLLPKNPSAARIRNGDKAKVIRLKSSSDSEIFDHSFLSPTYESSLSGEVNGFIRGEY